jgi:hypothetical protein
MSVKTVGRIHKLNFLIFVASELSDFVNENNPQNDPVL